MQKIASIEKVSTRIIRAIVLKPVSPLMHGDGVTVVASDKGTSVWPVCTIIRGTKAKVQEAIRRCWPYAEFTDSEAVTPVFTSRPAAKSKDEQYRKALQTPHPRRARSERICSILACQKRALMLSHFCAKHKDLYVQ